jgi:methyl-accepting chemotaxis protein
MYYLNKKVIQPLQEFERINSLISEGNLTEKVKEINEKTEIGEICRKYNITIDSLNKMLASAKGTSEIVDISMDNIKESMQEISSSAENIASSQQQISKGANEQVNSITDVQKKINILNDEIKGIVSKLQDIDEISILLKEISNKTNMLALNAAIESARAGEAGRGFNVVTDQVRKLSDESKKSVQMTEEKISQIKIAMKNQENNLLDIIKQVDKIAIVSEETSSSTEESVAAAEEQAASLQTIQTSLESMQSESSQLHTELKKFTLKDT